MIFRNLPALITLVAALVAWIVTFIYKYELTKALIIIFAAAFIFFVIGIIVRAILNRFLNPDTDKKEKMYNVYAYLLSARKSSGIYMQRIKVLSCARKL